MTSSIATIGNQVNVRVQNCTKAHYLAKNQMQPDEQVYMSNTYHQGLASNTFVLEGIFLHDTFSYDLKIVLLGSILHNDLEENVHSVRLKRLILE